MTKLSRCHAEFQMHPIKDHFDIEIKSKVAGINTHPHACHARCHADCHALCHARHKAVQATYLNAINRKTLQIKAFRKGKQPFHGLQPINLSRCHSVSGNFSGTSYLTFLRGLETDGGSGLSRCHAEFGRYPKQSCHATPHSVPQRPEWGSRCQNYVHLATP